MKGLPHALMHARELVETFGHHGACCTCVGEAGHKLNIKSAARLSRTYGDKNETQDGMLAYVQNDELWGDVIDINNQEDDTSSTSAEDNDGSSDAGSARHSRPPSVSISDTLHKLCEPLDVVTGWSEVQPVNGRPPRTWGATFLSKRLLIARTELVTLVRTALGMPSTRENITLLTTQVQWECFGVAVLHDADGHRRKVVGVSSTAPERRDFVRIAGTEHNTALTVQVCLVTYTSRIGITYAHDMINITSKQLMW